MNTAFWKSADVIKDEAPAVIIIKTTRNQLIGAFCQAAIVSPIPVKIQKSAAEK